MSFYQMPLGASVLTTSSASIARCLRPTAQSRTPMTVWRFLRRPSTSTTPSKKLQSEGTRRWTQSHRPVARIDLLLHVLGHAYLTRAHFDLGWAGGWADGPMGGWGCDVRMQRIAQDMDWRTSFN